MSLQIDYQVRKEQYQDLIRQAEEDWLRQEVKRQNSQPSTFQQVVGWLGVQMVRWGAALQDYATSPSANVSRVTIQTE
jgi:hypothetical protein